MFDSRVGSAASERSAAVMSPAATPWGECPLPEIPVPEEVETEVRKRLGARPGWLPRLGRAPWLARAMATLAAGPIAFAQSDLCDLVSLIVSQDNSCRYCYGVQRSLLKIAGYREESIARLESDFERADLAPGYRATLEFARRLSHANPRVTGPDLAALVGTGLEAPAAIEIAAMTAASAFMNRLATMLALPLETELESLPAMPLFRVLRPLMARRMRHKPRTPEPSPRPNDGPFAKVVDALGRSPLAGTYRQLIDDLFAAPALPRRTKALLIAVVAKALGCAYSEDEARALLARDGLDGPAVDEVLSNLASPQLDACESRLVPFARETIRYQAATIQQRVRELAGTLGADETVEMVVTVALANALGRLSVILDFH